MRFTPRKVIAVDVDGTLHIEGCANEPLLAWLRERHAEGFELMLWSAQGKEHAQEAAHRFGCEDLFSVICAKPGALVDDKGWSWIRETVVVTSWESDTGE